MPVCALDRMTIPVVSTLKTWGEVSEALAEQVSVRRLVVTGARFEGVDQPSLREAPLVVLALPATRRLSASRCSA